MPSHHCLPGSSDLWWRGSLDLTILPFWDVSFKTRAANLTLGLVCVVLCCLGLMYMLFKWPFYCLRCLVSLLYYYHSTIGLISVTAIEIMDPATSCVVRLIFHPKWNQWYLCWKLRERARLQLVARRFHRRSRVAVDSCRRWFCV